MSSRSRILIVDDHPSIREPLASYLERFDFEVETAADGVAMRQKLAQRDFSLIVLDVMMPGEDGLSLCRYVAEHLKIPVILLTAVTEQADRIAGLEVGADDYVLKPFDPRELVARIRSVLRRARSAPMPMPVSTLPALVAEPPAPVYEFEGWTFDARARRLSDPQCDEVALSTAEYQLLRALVDHANRVLSRARLLDLTQGADSLNFDRSIDSQVSRLRKKLEPDPRRPSMLKTVRGDGYLFSAQVTIRQP